MSPNTFELLQTMKTLYVHQVDSKCCMILIPRLERASLGEPMGNCESWNAGTQECGTEHGTEVMWFHTGNYSEMMQEVTINGSFPAAT